MARIFGFIIRTYQIFVSPFLGNRCRFYPSCSEYAMRAFERYSFAKALFVSMKRILKCHPFNEGGVDEIGG